MSDRQAFIDAELISLMRGEPIRSGTYRDVYAYLPDTKLVIKQERTDYKFDNIAEWELWQVALGTDLEKWLARCVTISPNGGALIQERTFPVAPAMLPHQVPACLNDLKAENWGYVWRNGKKLIVCHDYAHNGAAKRGIGKSLKLVKAVWNDPTYKGWVD